MLETFREYGRDRLIESGEADATGRAHAAYMLVVAEEETLGMTPAQRDAWLRSATRNTTTCAPPVTTWSARAMRRGRCDWPARSSASGSSASISPKGATRWRACSACPVPPAPTRELARALYGSTVLSDLLGERSRPTQPRGLRDLPPVRRHQGVADPMVAMAWQAQRQGRYRRGHGAVRGNGGAMGAAEAMDRADLARSNTATTAKLEGDFEKARPSWSTWPATSKARGDLRGIAAALNGLGDVAAAQRDRASARRYHTRASISTSDRRSLGDCRGARRSRPHRSGRIRLRRGRTSLTQALQAFRELGHQRGVARQLEMLSWCAGVPVTRRGRGGACERGGRHPAEDRHPAKGEREQIEQTLAMARALTPDTYANAWRDGRTATLEGAWDRHRAAPVAGRFRRIPGGRSIAGPPRPDWPACRLYARVRGWSPRLGER